MKKAVVESETQSIAANPSLKSARTYAARTSENAARKRMQFRNRRRTWSKTRKLTKVCIVSVACYNNKLSLKGKKFTDQGRGQKFHLSTRKITSEI